MAYEWVGPALSVAGNVIGGRNSAKASQRQAGLDNQKRAETQALLNKGYTGPQGFTGPSGQKLDPLEQEKFNAARTLQTNAGVTGSQAFAELDPRVFQPDLSRTDTSGIIRNDDEIRKKLITDSLMASQLRDTQQGMNNTTNQFSLGSNFGQLSQKVADRSNLGGGVAAEALYRSGEASDIDNRLRVALGASGTALGKPQGTDLGSFAGSTVPAGYITSANPLSAALSDPTMASIFSGGGDILNNINARSREDKQRSELLDVLRGLGNKQNSPSGVASTNNPEATNHMYNF